jgi:hypothetical protein
VVAEAPSLPDLRAGVIALLKGDNKTDAGRFVGHESGRNWGRPYTLIEHNGDIQQADTRVPRGRIFVHTYGADNVRARRLAYQVRDIMIPPENITWGVHATVTYEDERGEQRTIVISGAQHETGPRNAPESANHVITSYLVDYYRGG